MPLYPTKGFILKCIWFILKNMKGMANDPSTLWGSYAIIEVDMHQISNTML